MSLFQESIIRKYLDYLDQEVVEQAYLRFKKVYSANKISNIKIANEEQYQEGFIKDIFGEVLGYSVFPDQPFNIQTEKKNEANSKKADGAIFQGENVVGVIELKDNKTKNLDAVKDQAFGYKNNHKECSYVISSNFHKLRFYVDDATDYEEFDLYNLDKETFKRFYLYLHKEGLLDKNIPKLLRNETKFHEENITKSLYKDYSSFKNSFFQNVVKNNPQYDKLLLFKKSQKFLDKVLFVLFAEDKGLVSTNSIVQIVEKWNNLKNDAFDTPKPLYQLIALFFSNLFIGKKDQKGGVLIPEFGGEIFAPDEVLDTLLVDDEVLQDDLLKLSKYDFNTDVDVNILGHIFEHSLSEIEEVEASLKGEVADKTKGKRKKDGVFYTPKYITKYIVENTVGTLCAEKKTELKLDRDIAIFEYQKADGKLNAKGIELFTTLNQYKDWLLTLKILDPACGSGAFLNQAVNFLVLEHTFIDDIIAELTNSPLRLYDTDIAILENNIYGVDINEESIEIAKLSLWLRTARKGRKLSNLSNNIKCGNSLIDDPAVAGDKAFNWQNEFPEVFANGGFDVVIGNPPYVRQELLGDFKEYFSKNYKVFNFSSDLFAYFYEKAFAILRPNGLFSFISNTFDKTTAGIDLRKYLKTNVKFIELIDFTEIQIFEGATTYPIILIAKNEVLSLEENTFIYSKIPSTANPKGLDIGYYNKTIVEQKKLINDYWTFKSSLANNVLEKIQKHKNIREKFGKCYYGVKTSLNEAFITTNDFDIDNHVKYIYEGRELGKWSTMPAVQKLMLFKSKWTKSKYGNDISEKQAIKHLQDDYPSYFEILLPFEDKARKRFDQGDFWWELRNCAYYDLFEKPKIMFPNLQNRNKFCFDEAGTFVNAPAVFIPTNSKALLAILNSNLVWYFLTSICVVRSGGYIEVKPQYFEQIPIPDIEINLEYPLAAKAESNIKSTKVLQDVSQKFQRTLERKYALTELTKKLQDWYLLSYAEFIKELEKKKIKLSLSEEAEWETYFSIEAKKALELKTHIEKTDKEIDQMVYALYELTEDEIKVVEAS